ncbi:MAG TPA: hypothetical protein VG055_25575 [Planctomycetaceae bacterium]|jgi:hypothetical protein|nr:hypothetical protein [Planctomycetaceae bacterium]
MAGGLGISDRTVVVTLRLEADKANGEIETRILQQVNGAASRASQAFDAHFKKMIAAANGFGKAMRDALSKAMEAGSSEGAFQRAEKAQEALVKKGISGFGKVASGVRDLAKDLTVLSATSKESLEKMEESFKKFEAAFGVFEHGLELFERINKVLETTKHLSAGVGGGKKLLAGPGDNAGGESGVGSAAGGAATAAVAYAKGIVTKLGPAGEIAGIGAIAIAEGVFVHDAFKMLLNRIGFLGGQFDTLTGTVVEWNDSAKRSAEIEKRIAHSQETRKRAMEQMGEQQERVRRYYEGHEKIEEAHRHVEDAGDLKLTAASFRQRLASKPGPITRESLEADRSAEANAEMQLGKDLYLARWNRLAGRTKDLWGEATKTKQLNDLARGHVGVAVPDEAANEETVDESRRGAVESGIRRAADNTFGRFAAWWTGKGMGAVYDFRDRQRREATFSGQPHPDPMPLDLQMQLSQQEQLLKTATQLRDLAQERAAALQSQLATSVELVRAAKEQKLAAQEQVAAAQNRVNADKANLAMLPVAQQKAAAKILREMREGKDISTDRLLMLKTSGIVRGAIGRNVDERLAKTLDPEFAKEFKESGGEEDLDKAQQELTRATKKLEEAQTRGNEALENLTGAIDDYLQVSQIVDRTTSEVEATKSDMGHYTNPNEPHPVKQQGVPKTGEAKEKQAAATIDAAGKDFVAAIERLGFETESAIRKASDKARESAQRIKQAST